MFKVKGCLVFVLNVLGHVCSYLVGAWRMCVWVLLQFSLLQS